LSRHAGHHLEPEGVRLLLVNQFYPPDMAPTGQYLHDLAQQLVERGHEVTVLASRRSYDGGGEYRADETRDGVRVRRIQAFGFGRRGAARAADYLSFHLALWLQARDLGRFDLIVSLTTPPYLGWTVSSALGRRGRKRAHWVMDLYPDVVAAHGGLRPGGVVYRALQAVARRQFSGAALVLALGPRVCERVGQYVSGKTRLEWVPLWGEGPSSADGFEVSALRERRGWSSGTCVLLYSGNMGLGHRLGEFLAAAGRLGADGPVWAFAGGGRRLDEVRTFAAAHPSARVDVLPYVPQAELVASLAAADVHLVSLRSGWEGLIVPSKLQAAFGVGRPVIFVGPRESEPFDWIAASGGGWAVAEDDVDGLLRAVAQATDEEERARRGSAALSFAREHFDRDRNTARIAKLIEDCA
jgi:putative colanic acid biosynthesis glycosyltransferase WcaI